MDYLRLQQIFLIAELLFKKPFRCAGAVVRIVNGREFITLLLLSLKLAGGFCHK
jgi:hypothetical protein